MKDWVAFFKQSELILFLHIGTIEMSIGPENDKLIEKYIVKSNLTLVVEWIFFKNSKNHLMVLNKF